MTALFWVLAIAFGLVAGLVLAWPLWRGAGAGAPVRDAINVAIARERRAELDAELAAGRLDAAAHASARRDLELALAVDLEQAGARAGAHGAARRGWALLVLLGVPLASLGLYLKLGAPDALVPQPAGEVFPHGAGHPMAESSMQTLVEDLARRLEHAPNDPEGWLMLARSYKVLGHYPQAVEAYRKVLELVDDEADVLADLVDVLTLARGGRFDAETRALLVRALAAEPDHAMALWLAVRADLEAGDGLAALAKLDRLMPQFAGDAEATRMLGKMRRRARAMAGDMADTGSDPGGPVAQSGDPEGEERNVRPGVSEPVEIRIDRGVP